MPKRVMVIGYVQGNPDDRFSLGFIAGQLYGDRRDLASLLIDALTSNTLDVYDMQTLPAKGDAMDHLGEDLGLVIAMHLYGIDKMPVKNAPALHDQISTIEGPAMGIKVYCRDNFYLLQQCMRMKVPLVAYGDQPWYGAKKTTDLATSFAPAKCFLYEPE